MGRLTFFVFCAAVVGLLPTRGSGEEPQPKIKPAAAPRAEGLLFNGKDLTGWKVDNQFDFDRHGEVRVVGDAVVMDVGRPATGIVWSGDVPRNNYELTLEAKRISGDDFFCGLTFPIDKEYCTLILGGWGGGVTGLSNISGFAAVENETTGFVEFKNDQWYRVRLSVTPKKIEAWVDKEKIVDVETEDKRFSLWWEQEPMRPLGIATWNTKAAVRNIRLKVLKNGS